MRFTMPETPKPERYDPAAFETRWQQTWESDGLYAAADEGPGEPYYVLVEFPYPSGDGLHVGHVRSYTAMDAVARKRRMQGYRVLFPMGWDAFGLPTENFAIKTGIHPAIVTKKNTDTFRSQLKRLGFSFDWSREVNTTDPAFYKWTQWIFLKFFEKGLAYKGVATINWCPKDKVGLANEEVVAGCCERCGTPVEQREKEQWMLRITDYAEKLLEGLETVDYVPAIKAQQVNWIGKSEGAELDFAITGTEQKVRVFTTRADTLFGATYLVLAPEHPLVSDLTIANKDEVDAYVAATARRTPLERAADGGIKTGVELKGVRAINPGNKREIPIWIGDYVLPNYGTGAIMAVPAHDERDYAFAKAFGLMIITVIKPETTKESPLAVELSDQDLSELAQAIRAMAQEREHVTPTVRRYEVARPNVGALHDILEQHRALDDEALRGIAGSGFSIEQGKIHALDIYTGHGTLIESADFTGKGSQEARMAIAEAVGGRVKTYYHLRDWIFSRQRYWGEPIPVVHCEKDGWVALPEDQLPLTLPEVTNFLPGKDGESPLADVESWINTICPTCGGPARRETDTMPQWAGSSWYFMRYVDAHNETAFAAQDKLRTWLPVDWYNGGMEHTTLHLLYSRFWNRFLYDQGLVPSMEPYAKRTSQGMVLGAGGKKMSKSLGNVVNPDSVVQSHGADTLRVYEMFMGPFDQAIPWDPQSIEGVYRFLARAYVLAHKVGGEDAALLRSAKKAAKKVSDDIESMSFNTAVAALMIWVNDATKAACVPQEAWEIFLKALAPFAPHLAEELWHRAGHDGSVHVAAWPEIAPEDVAEDSVRIAVQVNGRTRDEVEVPAGASQEAVEAAARASAKVQAFLTGTPAKVIYVPGRIINFVL